MALKGGATGQGGDGGIIREARNIGALPSRREHRPIIGDLKVKWGSKFVVTVRAFDNVGLSWLEFKLKDIGTE